MSTQEDIIQNKVDLLCHIDLSSVSRAVCELVRKITDSPFVGLFFWDEDLEILTSPYLAGGLTGGNIVSCEKFMASFAKQFQSQQNILYKVAEEELDEAIPEPLTPLYCYEISDNDKLKACILFANKNNKDTKEILASLQIYSLSLVLSRAWEYSELRRENDRLRSSYEEMEEKTRMFEDQTRKLIQDLTMKDTIRTKHVERERLIYSISNVVRSYVDIQKVLETTVESIGNTFAVSRCLLIRIADNPIEASQGASQGMLPSKESLQVQEALQVYEFTKNASSVKNLFNSGEGIDFAHAALGLTRPQDLTEPFSDLNHNMNSEFLFKLDFRSGLIVPLLLREYSLGVLFLQDCAQPRNWNIDDISLIGSLADQISVAIENAELHQEQERQAITDGLTGVANRRSFNKTLAREFERAKRYDQPLSLIVLDLDHLKKINDSFGHQVGDEAIKAVGNVLKQSSRAIDLAARYGGEEFCLLLPNTELAMTEQLAERLRRLINEVQISGPEHISASLGIATYPLHASDADSLFKAADQALYAAKLAGRNLVKVSGMQ